MRRGEVWSVALPFAGGREQGGQRPAVVIQDDVYGQRSPLVLIVPVTSQQSAVRFPAVVSLAPSRDNGPTSASFALAFQARAADRSRFVQKLGTLIPADLGAILHELNRLTGQ